MDPYFVPTRASKASQSKHELFIHENQHTAPVVNNIISTKNSDNREEIDMKRARFEIYKFVQSALGSTEKQKSKIDLAIKLGGKPRKNSYINYKELQTIRRKEHEETRKKQELYNMPHNGSNICMKKSKTNKGTLRRKRKVGSGILNVYGKVNKRLLKEKK